MPGDGTAPLPPSLQSSTSYRSTDLYGHDAGQDGHGDADGATVTHKLEECWGLEEELRDDEVCSGVDLLL